MRIAPFTVTRPEGPLRLLFDSPHSGRYYPDDFETVATGVDLRRGEDAYVDDLLAGTRRHGAVLLAAVYPRCYLDVNRDVTDIDPDLLAEPWPGPLAPTEKSRRGLGLIRRYVVPGVVVPARKLTVAEVRTRIEQVYQPYHDALAGLVAEVQAAAGTVWHINWHSMKSVGNAMTPDGEGARRPDFVVSDREGTSADPAVTSLVVETLREMGYAVSLNDPYRGGTIVARTGNPAAGVHSVQVEINRALYLDEARVERTPGFPRLAEALTRLSARLAERLPAR